MTRMKWTSSMEPSSSVPKAEMYWIVTINTGREKDVGDEKHLKTYRGANWENENQPRCLFLTISGPAYRSLSMSLPFSLKDERVVLGKQSEFEPAILNMSPNWP